MDCMELLILVNQVKDILYFSGGICLLLGKLLDGSITTPEFPVKFP